MMTGEVKGSIAGLKEALEDVNSRYDTNAPGWPLKPSAIRSDLDAAISLTVKTTAKIGRMAQTPVSNFRIPLYIKEPAAAKAEAEGKTLSTVVIDLLREYIREEK